MKEKSLEVLLQEALIQNQELSREFGNYPPIHNSRIMLKEIMETMGHNPLYYLDLIRERPDLNVGLLAAKSLDFDVRFRYYADLLHKIWRYFFPLQSYVNKKKIAYDFYIKNWMPDIWIPDHLDGIDFEEDVEIEALPFSQKVYQWNINRSYHGDYYAKNINALPTRLGINAYKADENGRICKRVPYTFRVDEVVDVLASTAAAVLDTWSITWQPIKTSGGDIQYFNRKDKDCFK